MAQCGLGQEQEQEDFHPDFKEYMERELKYSRLCESPDKKPDYFWQGIRWVFWNRQDDAYLTLSYDHCVDSIPDVSASQKVRLNIIRALHELILPPQLNHSLVQFWAPTKTPEGRILLTAQNQPFALGRDYKMQMSSLLCEYRMRMCREYNNYFYADAESGEEQLGLPGRVFLNQLPESTPDVKHYSLKEYPQRDLALHFKISGSWALPVFEHSSHTCVGVLEISSPFSESNRWWDEEFLGRMYDIFQGFGLRCFDRYKHCKIQYEDKIKAAFQELNMVYLYVCNIHDLPLALTWFSCRSCNDLLPGDFQFPIPVHRYEEDYGNLFLKLDYILQVSKVCHLRKGQVTGRTLQVPNLLYCSDVKQFSIAEFPLVPYARYCELGGWFTMCLQSSYTGHELYVLEFFLPTSNKNNDENILTRLRLILDTMEKYFNTFKLAFGQGLGEALSVEVIDFQNGQRSRSNQMIPAARYIPGLELLQDEGVMLQQGQQDHPSMDAINNGMSVTSEAQNNFPSLDSLKNTAECGLGQEGEEYFLPDFKEYMERELKYSRLETTDKPPPGFKSDLPKRSWEGIGWVFWNRQDDNDLSLSYDHSVDTIPDVCASPKVRQNIRDALHECILHKELSNSLVQFWAPTKTSQGRTLLTTQFQPFALGMTHIAFWRNWLLGYRMEMCREYNSFYADAECGEEQLGLAGRVFLNKLSESTPKVEHYTLKEYPQRDLAIRCGIKDSWGLPVFERSNHTCVGVLEILSVETQLWHFEEFQGRLYDIFQKFGLLCFDGYKHCKMQYGDTNEALGSAFQELKMAQESVCKVYNLPLALAWVSCRSCSNLLQSQFQFSVQDLFDSWQIYLFTEVSKVCHLRKEQVIGRKLPFPNLLYCSDIKEFSIAESPLVPYARFCKLGGWFTVCLQSSFTGDELYMLEFFWPASNESDENIILTRLSSILQTMEICFKTFKIATGQRLGEALSVEVIDFQYGQRIHTIQMIPANRFSPSLELLQDGGVMLQRGQQGPPSMDAINNGMYVTSESQKYNLPSLDSLPNGKVTTQLDSFDQSSMDPSSNGQNVVTAERNIPVVSSSEEGKRKMQDRKHQKGGPRIDIPKEEILKYSHMYRNDAAAALNVGISTFKRVCRDHGIHRWPPRNIEKNQPFLPIENQGQLPQSNSDLPSNEASSSVANIKTGFQDADMVTIRAKCEKYTIKFCLSLPSRLVELQQEVAKRRKLMAETYQMLMAETYRITYKDEKDELILITCDEDLQDCIQFFRSLGNNDIYITLE